MTKQCREVMEACDFPASDIKQVEKFVFKCTVKQVISLVWSKDPKGVHEASWFAPFFDRGYVKSNTGLNCSFDEKFWSAYDWLSQSIEIFSIFDFPLIDDMARDTTKMKKAVGMTKVFNIPYIYKIYEGLASVSAPSNNLDKIQIDLGVSKAKPREF